MLNLIYQIKRVKMRAYSTETLSKQMELTYQDNNKNKMRKGETI